MSFSPVLADAATRAARSALCAKCEFKKASVFGVEVCGVCGCPLVGKTSLQHATCPKGKW